MDFSTITSMSALERRYFEEVGNQCSDDVERFCGSSGSFPPSPFLPFHSTPLRLSARDDFGSAIDEVLRQISEIPHKTFVSSVPEVVTPPSVETASTASLPIAGSERGLESPIPESTKSGDLGETGEDLFPLIIVRSSFSPCEEEQMIRFMLSQFIPPMMAVEDSTHLAHRLSEHGHQLLQRFPEDEDSQQVRIARRLSEVTPEEVLEHGRQMFLPFSSDKNECLVRAYDEFRLSASCGQAIQNLEHLREAQHHMRIHQHLITLDTCTNLFLMYFFVLATVVTLYFRRKSLFKSKRQLAKAIFRTVYSRPDLKSAVEKELGHGIGNDFPRPWKAMKHGIRKVRMMLCVLSTISILCLFGFVSVTTALRVGVVFAAFVFLRVFLMKVPSHSSDENAMVGHGCCDDCCCCDDTSSSDSEKAGADCCDDCCCDGTSSSDSDKAGADCCDDCCCCDTDSPETSQKMLKPRNEVYDGIAIQIV